MSTPYDLIRANMVFSNHHALLKTSVFFFGTFISDFSDPRMIRPLHLLAIDLFLSSKCTSSFCPMKPPFPQPFVESNIPGVPLNLSREDQFFPPEMTGFPPEFKQGTYPPPPFPVLFFTPPHFLILETATRYGFQPPRSFLPYHLLKTSSSQVPNFSPFTVPPHKSLSSAKLAPPLEF